MATTAASIGSSRSDDDRVGIHGTRGWRDGAGGGRPNQVRVHKIAVGDKSRQIDNREKKLVAWLFHVSGTEEHGGDLCPVRCT